MPLSEVRGQDHAVRALQRAWASGKLHHACLVEGPSGVGKSLLARETARMVLCAEPVEGPDGCGACRPCRLLDRGTNPDFVEVRPEEGKTVIGVGRVRELRTLVELPPHGGAARAVVIDDADRMSAEAQNALLKTLEEPPSRTFMLLTTSRPDNLLPTVRSRCSRLRLAPLAEDVLAELLAGEGGETGDEALRIAVTLAQGSVTRGRALLGGELDELVGLVEALHRAVEARSGLAVVALAEELSRSREGMVAVLELLALWYRDVLGLAATDAGRQPAFAGHEEELRACAAAIGVEGAAARVAGVLAAVSAVSSSTANPRLTAEAMLLRMLT